MFHGYPVVYGVGERRNDTLYHNRGSNVQGGGVGVGEGGGFFSGNPNMNDRTQYGNRVKGSRGISFQRGRGRERGASHSFKAQPGSFSLGGVDGGGNEGGRKGHAFDDGTSFLKGERMKGNISSSKEGVVHPLASAMSLSFSSSALKEASQKQQFGWERGKEAKQKTSFDEQYLSWRKGGPHSMPGSDFCKVNGSHSDPEDYSHALVSALRKNGFKAARDEIIKRSQEGSYYNDYDTQKEGFVRDSSDAEAKEKKRGVSQSETLSQHVPSSIVHYAARCQQGGRGCSPPCRGRYLQNAYFNKKYLALRRADYGNGSLPNNRAYFHSLASLDHNRNNTYDGSSYGLRRLISKYISQLDTLNQGNRYITSEGDLLITPDSHSIEVVGKITKEGQYIVLNTRKDDIQNIELEVKEQGTNKLLGPFIEDKTLEMERRRVISREFIELLRSIMEAFKAKEKTREENTMRKTAQINAEVLSGKQARELLDAEESGVGEGGLLEIDEKINFLFNSLAQLPATSSISDDRNDVGEGRRNELVEVTLPLIPVAAYSRNAKTFTDLRPPLILEKGFHYLLHNIIRAPRIDICSTVGAYINNFNAPSHSQSSYQGVLSPMNGTASSYIFSSRAFEAKGAREGVVPSFSDADPLQSSLRLDAALPRGDDFSINPENNNDDIKQMAVSSHVTNDISNVGALRILAYLIDRIRSLKQDFSRQTSVKQGCSSSGGASATTAAATPHGIEGTDDKLSFLDFLVQFSRYTNKRLIRIVETSVRLILLLSYVCTTNYGDGYLFSTGGQGRNSDVTTAIEEARDLLEFYNRPSSSSPFSTDEESIPPFYVDEREGRGCDSINEFNNNKYDNRNAAEYYYMGEMNVQASSSMASKRQVYVTLQDLLGSFLSVGYRFENRRRNREMLSLLFFQNALLIPSNGLQRLENTSQFCSFISTPEDGAVSVDSIRTELSYFPAVTVEHFANDCNKVKSHDQMQMGDGENQASPASGAGELLRTNCLSNMLLLIDCIRSQQFIKFFTLCRDLSGPFAPPHSLTLTQKCLISLACPYLRLRAMIELVTEPCTFASSSLEGSTNRGYISIPTLRSLLFFVSHADCIIFLTVMGLRHLIAPQAGAAEDGVGTELVLRLVKDDGVTPASTKGEIKNVLDPSDDVVGARSPTEFPSSVNHNDDNKRKSLLCLPVSNDDFVKLQYMTARDAVQYYFLMPLVGLGVLPQELELMLLRYRFKYSQDDVDEEKHLNKKREKHQNDEEDKNAVKERDRQASVRDRYGLLTGTEHDAQDDRHGDNYDDFQNSKRGRGTLFHPSYATVIVDRITEALARSPFVREQLKAVLYYRIRRKDENNSQNNFNDDDTEMKKRDEAENAEENSIPNTGTRMMKTTIMTNVPWIGSYIDDIAPPMTRLILSEVITSDEMRDHPPFPVGTSERTSIDAIIDKNRSALSKHCRYNESLPPTATNKKGNLTTLLFDDLLKSGYKGKYAPFNSDESENEKIKVSDGTFALFGAAASVQQQMREMHCILQNSAANKENKFNAKRENNCGDSEDNRYISLLSGLNDAENLGEGELSVTEDHMHEDVYASDDTVSTLSSHDVALADFDSSDEDEVEDTSDKFFPNSICKAIYATAIDAPIVSRNSADNEPLGLSSFSVQQTDVLQGKRTYNNTPVVESCAMNFSDTQNCPLATALLAFSDHMEKSHKILLHVEDVEAKLFQQLNVTLQRVKRSIVAALQYACESEKSQQRIEGLVKESGMNKIQLFVSGTHIIGNNDDCSKGSIVSEDNEDGHRDEHEGDSKEVKDSRNDQNSGEFNRISDDDAGTCAEAFPEKPAHLSLKAMLETLSEEENFNQSCTTLAPTTTIDTNSFAEMTLHNVGNSVISSFFHKNKHPPAAHHPFSSCGDLGGQPKKIGISKFGNTNLDFSKTGQSIPFSSFQVFPHMSFGTNLQNSVSNNMNTFMSSHTFANDAVPTNFILKPRKDILQAHSLKLSSEASLPKDLLGNNTNSTHSILFNTSTPSENEPSTMRAISSIADDASYARTLTSDTERESNPPQQLSLRPFSSSGSQHEAELLKSFLKREQLNCKRNDEENKEIGEKEEGRVIEGEIEEGERSPCWCSEEQEGSMDGNPQEKGKRPHSMEQWESIKNVENES